MGEEVEIPSLESPLAGHLSVLHLRMTQPRQHAAQESPPPGGGVLPARRIEGGRLCSLVAARSRSPSSQRERF